MPFHPSQDTCTTLLLPDLERITYHLNPDGNAKEVALISLGKGSSPESSDKILLNIVLNRAHKSPATLSNDRIIIHIMTRDNGYCAPGHMNPVSVLYATLWWYFHHYDKPAGTEQWQVIVCHDKGIFTASPEMKVPGDVALRACEAAGLIGKISGKYVAMQSMFWQVSWPPMKVPMPLLYMYSNEVMHPLRPSNNPGDKLYQRHIPSLNSVLHLRQATLSDASLLHKWLNIPRVNHAWGEAGDLERAKDFLNKAIYDSSHTFPVIGSWESLKSGTEGELEGDGFLEPFGYFEVYWVKEDRLGKKIRSHDWERGLHVLIGDKFRGPTRVKAWLSSLVHYCFMDDPRTQCITLEPREDNHKFIGYLLSEGFKNTGSVDLGHKISQVMRFQRAQWVAPMI